MVSIDVISGFLGAGKTTFANILINDYIKRGEKAVYIVNEFGESGLDAKIIENKGFKAFEMVNGCVCCTLKTELARTLKEVIETFKPQRVVFEPSGVFVFDNFLDMLKEPYLKENCKIGNIMTIVDGKNMQIAKILYASFVYNQIKNAPIILISKLQDEDNCEEIIHDVKSINEDAVIYAKNWDNITSEELDALFSKQNPVMVTSGTVGHLHEDLQSVTIEGDMEFTKEQFESFRNNLKNGVYGQIYRAKGVICYEGKDTLLNITLNDVDLKRCDFVELRDADYIRSLTFIGKTVYENKLTAWGDIKPHQHHEDEHHHHH